MAEPGLQIVEKVSRLLRAVSSAAPSGASTAALARDTDVARPTAHRLLTALAHQGLVDRDSESGLWLLGPELYLLGSVAAARYDVTEEARDTLTALATETGESAYLSAARGDHTVCLLEAEGSFPLRSHVLYAGIRLPLGVASAGLAILSHLPPEESARYVEFTDLTDKWGRAHSRAALRARVQATLKTGYALNPGLLVEGSWGLGAAVFDQRNRPAWALSLTGVESRLRPPRHQQLGKLLLAHAHVLTQRLARHRR
jgi:DNA-binding IclR family transcriptional regulator